MMFEISEVVLADTTKTIKNRDKKLFVRISTTNEKFLIINSRESEGSIKIESATYNFLSHDSYIAGFRTFILKEDEIIEKRGTINYDDMSTKWLLLASMFLASSASFCLSVKKSSLTTEPMAKK